jgi:hypothetical protein
MIAWATHEAAAHLRRVTMSAGKDQPGTPEETQRSVKKVPPGPDLA